MSTTGLTGMMSPTGMSMRLVPGGWRAGDGCGTS